MLYWKCQVARTSLQQWNPRIHWEASHSIYNSVKYCTDEDKRKEGGRVWTKKFAPVAPKNLHIIETEELYQWQKDLKAELEGDPDPRSIIWYTDLDGGSGKTAMAKYVLATFPCVQFLSGGNFRDTSYQIIKRKEDPRIVLVNLPRTVEGKVSYTSLESIKDGLIQCGKYEGGTRLFPPPHVIVFSNFMPDLGALSADRWELRNLRNNIRTL